jgi:hypothetical protein
MEGAYFVAQVAKVIDPKAEGALEIAHAIAASGASGRYYRILLRLLENPDPVVVRLAASLYVDFYLGTDYDYYLRLIFRAENTPAITTHARMAMATVLLDRVGIQDPLIIRIFRAMCWSGYEFCEAQFESLFGDSLHENNELDAVRKGVVWVLTQHRTELGYTHIDRVFSDPARPDYVELSNAYVFVFVSKAAKEYERLARHGYLATGKQYPPAYVDPPLDDEVALWRAFIQRYPWFPGKDDAYYRLAYALARRSMYTEALKVINRFRDDPCYDRDAAPYLQQLEMQLQGKLRGENITFPVNMVKIRVFE